jgi:hypothetical protein
MSTVVSLQCVAALPFKPFKWFKTFKTITGLSHDLDGLSDLNFSVLRSHVAAIGGIYALMPGKERS